MVDRSVIGSWLQGPGSITLDADDYPGRRLGYPQTGTGAVARVGRRFVALCVDWFLSLLLARGLLNSGSVDLGPAVDTEWLTLAVFTLVNLVLVGAAGQTVGHRLLGIRLTRLDGGAPGLARSAGRAVLLSLAVPALIWDRDQRGLHDKFLGTVLRRT